MAPDLFVGSLDDCGSSLPNLATIHALKTPCYLDAVGQRKRRDHHYLALERGTSLYLNMIDPRQPLFYPETFTLAMNFIDRHERVLVHCNQGQSRAPSIALLWLAKRAYGFGSFDAAREWFSGVYPDYQPGPGISTYLRENWGDLN